MAPDSRARLAPACVTRTGGLAVRGVVAGFNRPRNPEQALRAKRRRAHFGLRRLPATSGRKGTIASGATTSRVPVGGEASTTFNCPTFTLDRPSFIVVCRLGRT